MIWNRRDNSSPFWKNEFATFKNGCSALNDCLVPCVGKSNVAHAIFAYF